MGAAKDVLVLVKVALLLLVDQLADLPSRH
jgi:hypothetical protein